MAAVLDLPFKPKHKLIMVVLSNYANDAGENVYPSLSTMQRQTSLTRPAVINGLSDLKADKILILEVRGNVQRKSSRYHIDAKLIAELTSKPDLLVNGVYQSLANGVASTSKRRLPDPLLTMNDHSWMDQDPICQFLRTLPGFNPERLEAFRREVISHHYELAELPLLWNECALADNPIGLFTHKVEGGHHSIDWQMRQMEAQAEAELRRLLEADWVRLEEAQKQRQGRASRQAIVVDSSIDPKYSEAWLSISEEFSLEINAATAKSHVAPSRLISVNGSWRIAVPDRFWWQRTQVIIPLERIARGIMGHSIEFEFVEG